MENPYRFHFDVPYTKISRRLPDHTTRLLASADRQEYYILGRGIFSVQQLSFSPFYLCLFEFEGKHDFTCLWDLTESGHLLFSMLSGSMRLSSPESLYLSFIPDNHTALMYMPRALYRLRFRPGQSIVYCIKCDPVWLQWATQNLPLLQTHLKSSSSLRYGCLPAVRANAFIKKRLEHMMGLCKDVFGTFDGSLRLAVADILQHYAPLAAEKQNDLPHRIKNYLDHHFQHPGLSLSHLEKHFQISRRSLRGQFVSRFHTTIYSYYTSRRLLFVKEQMQQHQLPLNQLFLEAGYNDESTLRYQMKKFGLL